MRIEIQQDTRLVFAGHSGGNRLFAVFAGFFSLFFACQALKTAWTADYFWPWLVSDIPRNAPTGVGSALAGVFLFATTSLWWFLAMPFRVQVTRSPSEVCLVWGDWHVRRRDLRVPLAVVAKPRRYKNFWKYALYVRTSGGEVLLNISDEAWGDQRRAGRESLEVGRRVADFLGRPFDTAGWMTDPLTDTLSI